MANVITQIEMMKYRGSSVAVFPAGTIITPSAKDWAHEQGITVRFGDVSEASNANADERVDAVVAAVIAQMRANGKSLVKEDIIAATEAVLARLN